MPLWVEEHANEPATVRYGDGLFAVTVREVMQAIGGLEFKYYATNDGTGHFFELLADPWM